MSERIIAEWPAGAENQNEEQKHPQQLRALRSNLLIAMSPALQSLIDQAEGLDQGSHTLENHLGGTSGVQLTQLASVARTVDLVTLATLAPALQRLANIALDSQATNPYQLEMELGGTAGVQLAILACLMAQAGGGGGGGDFLPLAGGTMDTDAEIAFDNAASIRQTPNDQGLDLVCSIGYIHRWKEGSLYILDQSGGIRSVQYGLSFEPDANYDSSEGYIVGSRYIKDDGTTFECTDNTEGEAVWEEVGGGGGGGGGNISDPNVAYITSDGSDAHGVIGNPHKPFLTGTAAFNDGARSFDFGVGNFSITTDPSTNTSIFIRGKGYGNTYVYVAHIVDPGTPGEAGAPGLSGEEVWTPGGPGGNGGNGANAAELRVDSDYSAYIAVFAKGGDGGAGGAGGSGGVGPDFGTGPSYEVGGIGGNGGNGGNMARVELHNVTGTVSAGAGAGGAGGAGGTSGIGDALPGSSGSVGTCETAYVTMCRLFQDSGTETFPLQKIGSVFNGLFVAS